MRIRTSVRSYSSYHFRLHPFDLSCESVCRSHARTHVSSGIISKFFIDVFVAPRILSHPVNIFQKFNTRLQTLCLLFAIDKRIHTNSRLCLVLFVQIFVGQNSFVCVCVSEEMSLERENCRSSTESGHTVVGRVSQLPFIIGMHRRIVVVVAETKRKAASVDFELSGEYVQFARIVAIGTHTAFFF